MYLWFNISHFIGHEDILPDIDKVDTLEQFVTVLNGELDKMKESFDKAVRDIQEILASTRKSIEEMEKVFLEENERKYVMARTEILEMEEECKKDESRLPELIKKLQAIPNEVSFAKFGYDFYVKVFNKIIIIY